MTANIPRTASRALANAALPTLKEIMRKGVAGALRDDAGLRKGVYLYKGQMVNENLGGILELAAQPLEKLVEGE
jgi:alanine dehydrogenase